MGLISSARSLWTRTRLALAFLASGVRCLCELYPSLYLWKSVSQVYDINMGFCAPISGCRSFLSGNKPCYYMEICCSHAMMQDFNNQWHPSKRFHLIPFYLPVQESIKNLNVSPQTVNYCVATLSVCLNAWAAAPTLQNIEGLYFGVHNKHLSWWWSFPVPLCPTVENINTDWTWRDCVFLRFLDRQDESPAADCRSWYRQGIKRPAGF